MHDPNLAAAQAYEESLVTTLFGPWARRAVEIASPLPGEVILDLACGTGIGLRLMSPLVGKLGKIISVDNDPSMIILARQLYETIDDEHSTNTEWFDCGAESMALGPNLLDLCTLFQGPNFLADPQKVLNNVLFSLKPSGRVVGSTWGRIEENKGHYAIATALERLGFQPALKPFSFGDTAKLQELFTSSGFIIEKILTEQKMIHFSSVKDFVSGVAAGAPATRHAISQLDENTYKNFFEIVEELLSGYSSTNGVALPTQAHIVLALPAT